MTLAKLAEGVFVATGPISIVGMALTTTMTVIELGRRELVLVSPLPLTPALRAEIDALGVVAHLVAPNTYHHLSLGVWASAYPSARVHGPPGLRPKRPDLRLDRTEGPEPAFDGVLDEVPIAGFRLEERVLVHRPSRTAIVADLVHHVGAPPGAWTTFYTSAMGFRGVLAQSRVLRWLAYDDRRAARRSVDTLLSHDFDRLVVGHGTPIERGAREALGRACAWLT